MKGPNAILIIVILFLLPSFAHSSGLGSLRISLIRGDVQLQDDVTGEWSNAMLNMPLREGDTLLVPEAARVEIQMDDGSFLRLDEYSTLKIIMISDGIVWFDLKDGRAYVNLKGTGHRAIKIGIPYLTTLRSDVTSRFSIDLRGHRYAEVSVFKGEVYAQVGGGDRRVYAGERLTINEDMYADVSSLGPADEWERWNKEMDRRFDGSWYGYRYLPDELRVYAYEFDTNGRWVYTTGYGYVWVPTVYVGAGWSPYRYGRWVWIGDHYVWVSYEPWGWVPYHYGRWAFSVSIGWFWVPPSIGAVYWGPGFVGWIYTPYYVAWVPLAPEDIYYGYGYYGPQSVNIIHIDVHNTVIKNVYKNVYVNNAVTVVSKDSFIKGKYVHIKNERNPFIREGIASGRTRLVSDRALFVPIRDRITINEKTTRTIDRDRGYDDIRVRRKMDAGRDRTIYREDRIRDINMQRERSKEDHRSQTVEKRQDDKGAIRPPVRGFKEDNKPRDGHSSAKRIYPNQQERQPNIPSPRREDIDSRRWYKELGIRELGIRN
ncbi:MAG: FecR domain-containing protein [Thermodesulfovibrionia bacterium]